MNLVTGYFTINALSDFYNHINTASSIDLILGELVIKEDKKNKIVDLLRDNLDIDSILQLNNNCKNAIEFINQKKVNIKHISENFCHAKAFIYEDKDNRHKFYIIGSSNLTEAGLGIKESANIELNIAITGGDSDYKNVLLWFRNLWENVASSFVTLSNKEKIDLKQYLIEKINTLGQVFFFV